jgi:hypothetical protein
MNLDNPPPAEALREAAAHPDIHSLRVIHLPQLGELPGWLRT